MKKFELTPIPSILLPLLILSSCGGSSGDNDSTDSTGSQDSETVSSNDDGSDVDDSDVDSDPVTGLVRLTSNENFAVGSSVNASVSFGLTDQQDLFSTIARLNRADVCSLSRTDGTTVVSTGRPIDIPNNFDVTLVLAGDEVAINVDGSLFQSLQNVGGQSFYTIPNDTPPIAGPVPENITVTIPGSAMVPSFTNEAVPGVEGIVILNSDLITLDRNTGFQWEAPTLSVENSNMTVNASLEILDVGDEIRSVVFLECSLVDDGSFVFPEEFASFIDQEGLSSIEFNRTNWRTVQNGNATLHLLNEVRLIPDRSL